MKIFLKMHAFSDNVRKCEQYESVTKTEKSFLKNLFAVAYCKKSILKNFPNSQEDTCVKVPSKPEACSFI